MKYSFESGMNYNIGERQYYLTAYNDDVRTFAQPLIFEEVEQGETMEPFITEDYRDHGPPLVLLAIFNGLWNMGIRPDGFEDRNRETKALGQHLEDMRQLVFKDKHNPL